MTVLYSNNFDSDTVGAGLTGWTVAGGTTFAVSTTLPVSGTKSIEQASYGSANTYSASGSIADQAVRTDMKVKSATLATFQQIGHILRSVSASNFTSGSYTTSLNPATNGANIDLAIYVVRKAAGSYVIGLSSVIITVAINDIVHMESRIVGDTISVWLWKNSDPKPGSASYSVAGGSHYSTGYPGIWKADGVYAYVYCDNLVVTDATGGEDYFDSAPDTTAPTLTSPTGTQTGSTTATVGATTDEANGTMYAVVTVSGTAPSVAQIQAGQDNSGAAAAYSGSQSVSSTGAKTFSATGLAASTAYYAHIQHKDAAGNDSTVVTSAQFTTASGASALAKIIQLLGA